MLSKRMQCMHTTRSMTACHACRPVETLRALSHTKTHPELIADGPLCILHGTDSWDGIGLPQGSKAGMNGPAAVDAWAADVMAAFPQSPKHSAPDVQQLARLPPEEGVALWLE